MTAQKRESILHFANTAASGSPAAFAAMNIGFNSADESLNAETSDKQYIGQASATQVVNRIMPNIAYNMNIENGDPVCELFYECHKKHITDKQIEIVHVFTFETATEAGFPAIKRTYTIQPDSGGFAGEGGSEIELTGNLAQVPNSDVEGYFDTTTLAFTAE